ncbi:MAG: hypothetical protein AB2745_19145 [Candidatus Thiodiazotropha endolucinida]
MAGPRKDSNTNGFPRPKVEAGEKAAFCKSPASEVETPSTAPANTSSRGQEASKSQMQVEVNEQIIETEISLPLRQAATSNPLEAAPENTTSSQITDKTVPANRLPENNPDVSLSQEEQKPHTEDVSLKEKNLNDAFILKKPAAESDGEEIGERMPDNPKPCDTGVHREIELVNPAVEIATGHYEHNKQPKERVADNPLERETHTEDRDTSKAGSKNAPERKKGPAKYQPSIRSPNITRRIRNSEQSKAPASRARTLRMHLHAMHGRRNQFRISLLPERPKDFDENVEIKGPDNQVVTWSASQDDWYADVDQSDLGNLLVTGAEWELNAGVDQIKWVLSGREIYVLASDSKGTISGYIPVSRLILFEEHLVLCARNQEQDVRQALDNAGCSGFTYMSDAGGMPAGWVLFHHVRPTVAVAHDNSAGIINILRPTHDIEIVLQGGIRLSHSSWLNAHPPVISIHGGDNKEMDVIIDGNTAYRDESGKYVAEAWDKPGQHTVFCGGVTQSYELVNSGDEWEFFDAFFYAAGINKQKTISVCGPAVLPSLGSRYTALIPKESACIIGAVPGQIVLASVGENVSRGEYIAVADFPIAWVLPSNPLTCNKSSSYVKMIGYEEAVEDVEFGNRRFNQDILHWCQVILNASRRKLGVEPPTEEANQLWESYKKVARRYWRRLR